MRLLPIISLALYPSLGLSQTTAITVDLTKTYQTISGFGFSQAFQRAVQLYKLAPAVRDKAVDIFFNTTSGAAFSILRNGIGSSPDSSSDHMNTILPRNPGSPSLAPAYVWDGNDSGQLWMSKQALAYGVKNFYANAWSAPGFMKTNGNDAGGGSLCGLAGARCNSGDWRQAYADYLIQYVKYYAQEGIPITHLGFLNEPEFTASYASMISSGSQSAEFIKILSPTLAANNLSSIKITCCDAEGWQSQAGMTQQIVSAGAESLLGVVTSHPYTSQPGSPFNTRLPVWQTEWADLNGGWTTAWYSNGGAGEGMTWATRIHSGLTSSNISGYFAWVGTQSGGTNEPLMRIDGANVIVSKRVWAFGQFSRFVRPGAVRVATGGGTNLRISAFKNAADDDVMKGALAVQVINSGTGATTVNIKVSGGTAATAVKAWVTDNTRDLNETTATLGTDGSITGSVPARSMVSFVIS
ncbi:glycoside hydrolase superfamily [Crepidotus variabilis]|uniref:Glycoside hydrolase superfamily n=1 Tax=Crepidotus variabilis TaxID=179855 RepID=A0A9P6EJ60_9AGAR|nr:glycoside hydrolase superfamily [Crepidotus variabilis]